MIFVPRMRAAALSAALFLALPSVAPAQEGAGPFAGCSASERADLETAIAGAVKLAGDAAAYLEGVAEDQRRFNAPYETWFGSYDTWRYGRVAANYRAIETTLASAGTRYRCGCPTLAAGLEVNAAPGPPAEIQVCKAFWSAAPSGGRSRAGSLIQAASALPGTGGAEALAASQLEATTLAGQRPADAIRNAATYRYFAEEEKEAGAEHVAGALGLILLLLLGEAYRRARAQTHERHREESH